jgi:hypothetical protein
VRGQKEEKIEKVSARSRFSASNVFDAFAFILLHFHSHTHTLSLDVCVRLLIYPFFQVAHGGLVGRDGYTREFVAIFRKNSGDECRRN